MKPSVQVSPAIKMSAPERKEFYKELFALAVPIGLQSLLVALLGATDALMLGRLTQDSVAAVSLANQIAFIMSLFLFSLVGGGSALIAQYWGKGDKNMVKNLFCTMLKYSTLISFVFFSLAFLIPEKLMGIYTNEAELISIGGSYLRAVSFSYLFNGLNQCYFQMMKVEDRASRSVFISVAMLITDVVLDYFLIYGNGPFPALGANGSAYSTIGVEAVALIWCIIESHRPGCIHPDAAGLKWFSRDILKDLLKIALPMLASALAWGLGYSAHSLLMGHMGFDATAAASITSVMLELITCMCKGLSAGAGIMIGKLLGDSQFEKAKTYGRAFWGVSLWCGVFNMALLAVTGPVILHFFVLTETARQYLIYMLIFTGAYGFAYSLNTIITCGVFPAGGDAIYDSISVFFSMWCFALPLAFLGLFVFHWPVMAVYIVMCMDEIVKLPWIYPRYKKYLWLTNLTREDEQKV